MVIFFKKSLKHEGECVCYAASGFSLVSLWFQAEKGNSPSLRMPLFAIQADLPTCELGSATVPWHWLFFCPAPKVRAYFGEKAFIPVVDFCPDGRP